MKIPWARFGMTWVLPLVVGIGALLVYCATMAPGLDFIDAGELATVATTLGIAHPTGYPVFTLVGHLFALVPVGSEPIVRLNFMAAFFCALGIVVFVRLMLFVLSRQGPADGAPGWQALAAAVAGLLLAFSETYWAQATSVEVYSLHLFLVLTVLYVFLRAQENDRKGWWILFPFVLGASFANHMTTILLAPGFLYYYFARQGFGRRAWRRVLSMVPPFLLGLSFYLYLPLRAGQNPVMDWGHPVTLERFFWHWSGAQYRSWIFSSMAVAGKQFSYFLASYPGEFAYVGGLLAITGCISLWFMDRKAWWFTLLLFVGCVGYSINYDIHDIDSYFLLSYVVTAMWAGWGTMWILQTLAGSRRVPKGVMIALAIAGGMAPLFFHFSRENERHNYLVEDYTRNMFASFDTNAVVLSFQWDYWVSASEYEQIVRGIRPDVTVIDKELLKRSWYFHQLGERHPWLVRRSRAAIEAFLGEVDKFEHGRPYNALIIEARYAAVIRSIIETSLPDHPVYVGPEIEPQYVAGFQRVPQGLAFRLFADTVFHPTPIPEYVYRPLARAGRLEDQVRKLYADSWLSRGDYYFGKRDDRDEAVRDYERAYRFEPGAALIMQRIHFMRAGKMANIR
jgi:hypothetical protein